MMNKAPFFLLALFSLAFIACENDLEKVNLVTEKSKLPVETSTGMRILYSDSGIVRVQITAPELNRYETDTPYVELPKGVKVEFYGPDKKVTSTMTSKYAIRKEREFIIEARNDVVVINEKGEKLNTEHLIWDERNGKIISNEFVKISTADKIIFGDGLEASQDFTKYKIFKIKGTIAIDQDEHTSNP